MKAPKALQAVVQKLRQKLRDRVSKLSYRRFVVLLALFCCMLFAFVLFLMPAEKPKKVENENQEQPKVELVKVVTANRDIDPQTIIREDMLQSTELPKTIIPDGAVTDSKMAINLPAAVPIQKGDVLTTKKFYSDIRMAGFPGRIPDDCRAVSVAISDITGVSGFAKPGDHVDVIVILGKRNAKHMKGELLLQNVLLLGINKNAKVDRPTTTQNSKDSKSSSKDGQAETSKDKDKDSKDKDKNAESGSQGSAQAMATATLAVTPNDALKLAVASQNGTIYLTLRPVVPKEGIALDKEYVYVDETQENDNERNNYAPASEQVSSPQPTSTPNASVPLPPQSSNVTAQVPELTRPSLDPVASIEVIRGTESSKGNASSSSRASSRKNSN